MHKKFQPNETTGRMKEGSGRTKEISSLERVMETLCKEVNVTVSYNLAEVITILKNKQLITQSELERLARLETIF